MGPSNRVRDKRKDPGVVGVRRLAGEPVIAALSPRPPGPSKIKCPKQPLGLHTTPKRFVSRLSRGRNPGSAVTPRCQEPVSENRAEPPEPRGRTVSGVTIRGPSHLPDPEACASDPDPARLPLRSRDPLSGLTTGPSPGSCDRVIARSKRLVPPAPVGLPFGCPCGVAHHQLLGTFVKIRTLGPRVNGF